MPLNFNIDRGILTDVLVATGKYPALGPPYQHDGLYKLHGQLTVLDERGERWGAFLVTIIFPENYPYALPLLFEDQGRIRQEPDWHVNGDGSLCIGPEVSELLKYNGKADLADWLDRSAVPYLANHLHRERTGTYVNGEYAHGPAGIWQFYLDWWQCTPKEVLRRLEILSGKKAPVKSEPCICGSQLSWRHCHHGEVAFPGVSKQAFAKDLSEITNLPYNPESMP